MDACRIPQQAEACAVVIFGASGDLTKRKLLPSLYNLASYHLLPVDFSIIGVARRDLSDEVFRDRLGQDLARFGTQPVDQNVWSQFRRRTTFQVRAKVPGPTICTRSVKLEFDYNQFGDRPPTTGYEKLLYDCMVGDGSLLGTI